ncbi:hypothetical protein R1sor_015122 [Riccia sorocarpa]|uniref:F-box domain-containing protein n=1 Tax=Riccia sorocarpa TaxID=122646 RepID=A0ABD3HBN9_9MARC
MVYIPDLLCQSVPTMTEYDLIPSIWQNLPIDLLEKVMTKLPVRALQKFYFVSKQWKDFIESEQFARESHSSQGFAFYYWPCNHALFITPLRLKSKEQHLQHVLAGRYSACWEKRSLDFIPEAGRARHLLAASKGMVCYHVHNRTCEEEIAVVVHNFLTGRWRRLVVPHKFVSIRDVNRVYYDIKILGGLTVDEETGNYQLVIAFIYEWLPRKTFIYDSKKWTVSAALSPVVESHCPHHRGYRCDCWTVNRSICCAGAFYWFIQEGRFKTLIKYSLNLDTWSMVTQQSSSRKYKNLHLTSFDDRPFMVNFDDAKSGVLVPEEFSSSFPEMETFGTGDAKALLDKAFIRETEEFHVEEAGEDYEVKAIPKIYVPTTATAEGRTWFIQLNCKSRKLPYSCVISVSEKSPPTLIHLPDLRASDGTSPFILACRFRAFV